MSSTRIWLDTIRRDVCKAASCRKPIFFAINVRTGNANPFDEGADLTERTRELGTSREMATVDMKFSHFATCPARAQFRRARKADHA